MNDDRTPVRRSRNPLARAFAEDYAHGTVTEVEPVTPTLVRIRIHSPAAAGPPWTPGRHVRVQINDPLSLSGLLRPGETLRTYTVWEHRPAESCFDIRAHLYGGEGIGLRWVRGVRAGDPVTYWGPQGDLALREATYHLFAGEETAACAFGPMLRALGPGARVFGVVESETPEDAPPLPGPPLRRVYRHGAPAVSSAVLPAAVAGLELPEPGGGAAYVAGEAQTCRQIRDHLVRERG